MRWVVVGTVAKLPTKAAALRELEVLRANVNREVTDTGSPILMILKSLVEHYRQENLLDEEAQRELPAKVDRAALGRVPPW